MTAADRTCAGCLTPPAAGGLAVIQVIGCDAPERAGRFLRAARPLDLRTLGHDQLRLCRFMVDDSIIDDAVVCVRPGQGDVWIVDLSVHGGPRIVQRVLMALRADGVEIVPAQTLLEISLPGDDALEAEALTCLREAQTRDVARWLLRSRDTLRECLDHCLLLLGQRAITPVREHLADALAAGARAQLLLRGARVVVVGRPNAGKSTLVNRLAEREQIVVSPHPGTTRDYVEQPAAIGGVPMLLVDTAGLRETVDALEREAMDRGRRQISNADLILHVIDATSPPDDTGDGHEPGGDTVRVLCVWNKVDLPIDPIRHRQMNAAPGWPVSAATGEGLGALREGILEALGLLGWAQRTPAVFTDRQRGLLSGAIRHLSANSPDLSAAGECVLRCRVPQATEGSGGEIPDKVRSSRDQSGSKRN